MSRPGLLLRWCVPDLAFATACVTLFYCLFLFQGYQKLFRDSDAGWHIRTGEAILATGNLPRTDPYSFTRGGQPWFAWEWMADVAVGAIHRTFGLKGVAVFYAAAISAGVWLWFRLHWALGGNFLVACAMAPLLLSTCNIHWLARPHVLSWIFVLLAVFPRQPNLIVVGLVPALSGTAQPLRTATLSPRLSLSHRHRPARAHRGVSILRLSERRRRADCRHGHPRGDRRHPRPDREAPAPLCACNPDHGVGPALRARPAARGAAPAAHRQCGDYAVAECYC